MSRLGKIAAGAFTAAAGAFAYPYVEGSMAAKIEPQTIVKKFGLIPHPEGGFFREIYRSGANPMASQGATDPKGILMKTDRTPPQRNVMTSIYWLLNQDSPNGWWCSNKSDHIHYYHAGAGMTYFVIHPDGKFEKQRVGPNIEDGDVMQFFVAGGCLKACTLGDGDFVLIGESVAPGFDFRDFRWVTEAEIQGKLSPEVFAEVQKYVKPDQRRNFEEYYAADKGMGK